METIQSIGKASGVFPEETLAQALAKIFDPDVDGVPCAIKWVGHKTMEGEMDKPCRKFEGRECEVG